MTNKKKLSQRLYEAIWPPQPKGQKRGYQAARVNRLNANWTTYPTGANYEIRGGLAALRARSRQAARDNGHIRNFLRLMCSNVIGPKGIQLQSRARLSGSKTLDVELNKKVEEAWFEWTHREHCTISTKLDWRGVQKLALTQLLRDGEFLIEMIEGVGDFGLSLKIWDVNWLDETYNDTMPNGNRVIMSVEIDANERPVAFWLTTPSSEMNFTNRRERTRTRKPAESMIHGYLIEDDESQVRSVSWITPALLDIKNFQGYTEGVVTSARVSANTFGFVKQQLADGEEWTGEENEDGTQTLPMIDSSPLSVNLLNPGMEFQQFDPKQPTQNHPAFSKTMQTSIGTDLSIPYFLLVGDWEAVNFSSSRGGLGEFHEMCKDIQDFISTLLCRRVYHVWARNAMLAGRLSVTARQLKEIRNATWRPRGWPYIDPTKDVAADVERLRNRLATPSEILSERGVDYVDFLERWKSDREMAASYAVNIEEIYSAQPGQPDNPPEPPPDQPTRGYLNGHDTDEMLN